METARPPRIWVVALISQLLIAAVLIWAVPASDLRDGRLIIVAPPVVSTALVETAAALPHHPFDARAAASAETALADLRAGHADAVVVVDLLADHDRLYVSAASGPRGQAGFSEAVSQVEASLGRSLDVTSVPVRGDRHTPYLLVLICMVLGFAAAVVVAWRHGTFATTLRAGLRRTAFYAGFGLVVGACWFAAPWPTPVLAAALVVAAAVTTNTLTALFGLVGLSAASLLFILTAAPLGRFTPVPFVPQPWRGLSAAMPHGAGLDLASTTLMFGSWGSLRAWAVLLAWIVLGWLTLVLSRVSASKAPGAVETVR